MMAKITAIIHDKSLMIHDNIKGCPFPPQHRSGVYAKTQILGGHGIITDINGVTSLKELTMNEQNMIPIGGVQYSFENLFGVGGPLKVPTLYEVSNGTIGIPDVSVLEYGAMGEDIKYYTPALDGEDGISQIIHPIGEYVCLYGVGITGSATNSVTKPPVNFLEYSIQNSLAVEDERQLTGTMIPFRYTANQLTDAERIKYFGKTKEWSADTVENIGYYLKRFESEPQIKHYWKAETDEFDSTNEVTQSEYYPKTSSTNSSTITSYTEMILKITTKDIKEWFDANNNIDATRINTIALFTGRYNKELGDYENVRLFSKLVINVENLSLEKDFDIIYRVFGS